MQNFSTNLLKHCRVVPRRFRAFSEEDLSHRSAPGKWSRKEIIGHLIDSAANNHQRWVRAMRGEQPKIVYEQNDFVRLQNYQNADSKSVIGLWENYNRHLAHLALQMSEADLGQTLEMYGREVTLKFCVEDYLRHLEHHLRQFDGLPTAAFPM